MGTIVVHLSREGPPDAGRIQRMLAASPHMGTQTEVAVLGSCALGTSTRTDIVDAAIFRGDSLAVGFTGNLDNAPDIARDLGHAAGTPYTGNHAFLVAGAFRVFGVRAPAMLRGSFAAFITDGSTLWCFRDHLGWRAIHYAARPDGFFAASEAKQVIEGAGLRRDPNMEVLETILYGRENDRTPSAYVGVERVPQATMVVVERAGITGQSRYWNPADVLETASYSADDLAAGFHQVFETAVGRCVTGADVISLSGGIDSPAVAAFASPIYKSRMGRAIGALSTVYPNHPKVDESSYIRLIADRLGIELHTFTPTAGPWDNLARWCSIFDCPVPTLSFDEVAEYNERARTLGFRNVLGGDVAEVVFNLNRHVIGHLVTQGRWKPLSTMLRTLRRHGSSRTTLISQMLAPLIPGRLALAYMKFEARKFPSRVPAWMDEKIVDDVPARSSLLRRGRERYAAAQLIPYSGSTLTLEAGEICALLCGVTTRSPFADIDVCEFFLSLRAEDKFPDLNSKTLVRQLLRGKVPDAILDRRDKTEFSDYIMSHVNYDALRRHLINPGAHIAGVDYENLARRIEREDFTVVDYVWANDLVRIHAFLGLWQ